MPYKAYELQFIRYETFDESGLGARIETEPPIVSRYVFSIRQQMPLNFILRELCEAICGIAAEENETDIIKLKESDNEAH